MRNKGLLVIFSGPSGCGKGTVLKELLQHDDSVYLSVSATTRSPREGEQHGVHYYFLSKEEFERLIQENGMLEYASYCGNYYGTPRAAVEKKLNEGLDVILEIEVQGALQVMEHCPEAVSIFILPPSVEELEKRLFGRQTEDIETISKRLLKAKEEMTFAEKYDYVVVNNAVLETANQIEAILTAEKFKQKRMKNAILTVTKS